MSRRPYETKPCAMCGEPFGPRLNGGKYLRWALWKQTHTCSPACRSKLHSIEVGRTRNDYKICADCGQNKPLSSFYPCHRSFHAACKPCHHIRSNEWKLANPEKVKRIQRRQHLAKYGITVENFDLMLEAQGGVCAICKGLPYGQGARLHVDHNAQTGAVRGLLCTGCNAGIGRFKDNPMHLRAAATYLEQSWTKEATDSTNSPQNVPI